MKVRIEGDLDEIVEVFDVVKKSFEVIDVSKPYKNRDADNIFRCYIEIRQKPTEELTSVPLDTKLERII